MKHKFCDDCGSKVFNLGCINCNEEAYIAEQAQMNGDARCNYCDGQMPCYCERPVNMQSPEQEAEIDLENRNRIDFERN